MSINLIDYRYSLPFPNAISGLLISNNGLTSIDTSSGVCTDSTNAINIALAATMTKTQASWAAGTGNGGLDTGVIANSTWYHFYVIHNATTNIQPACISRITTNTSAQVRHRCNASSTGNTINMLANGWTHYR